jgi:hypothetical protein
MHNSIYLTVYEELRARMEGARRLIERTARYEPDELRRKLREHSELAGNTLLQVADHQGNWLYRSASMNRYEIPRPVEASTLPSTLVLNNVPLRVLPTEIQVGDESYRTQAAAPLDVVYTALHCFATLLLVSIPILLLSAAAGGYWLSRRALAPVDQITQTARSISVQNLSSRLNVPQTGDQLQRRVDVVVGPENGFAIGEVRDTGIGIAPEDLPNVFERFYRADKARSRQSGGVGLGLSIGRWIAEAHSGTMEVQSSLGGGSIFQVRLPLVDGKSLNLNRTS